MMWGCSSSRCSPLVSISLMLLVLLCGAAHVAHGFTFVPVLYSFAVPETTGSKLQSRLLCQQGGGFSSGVPTAMLHQSVIDTVRAAGAGETWYTFLGADTNTQDESNCPPPITVDSDYSGASYGCYWRWNQGRWAEIGDNPELPLHASAIGVTFFIGNAWRPLKTSVTVLRGPASGFPNFFDATNAAHQDRRPGMLFGQDLVVVGRSDNATWSDNLEAGGYSYAEYEYSSIVGVSRWNTTAQEASKPYFWAACQAQGPSRTMYEMENTSSGLQKNWWVIFFVILMVVMFVVFVVVACCQDDEDMDEPPEDAPGWVQQETQDAKRPKTFVSTRTFGNTVCDDEKENEKNGSGNQDDDDSNHASSHPQPQPQQQQQPAMSVSPSVADSRRHLGRQNGSPQNSYQQSSGWFSQDDDVAADRVRQPSPRAAHDSVIGF